MSKTRFQMGALLIGVASLTANGAYAAPKAFGKPDRHIDHVNVEGQAVPVTIFTDTDTNTHLWVLPTRAKVENTNLSRSALSDCSTLATELDTRKAVVQLVNNYVRDIEIDSERLEGVRKKIRSLEPSMEAARNVKDASKLAQDEMLTLVIDLKTILQAAQQELAACMALADTPEQKATCQKSVEVAQSDLNKAKKEFAKRNAQYVKDNREFALLEGQIKGLKKESTDLLGEIESVQVSLGNVKASIHKQLEYYADSVGGYLTAEFDFAPAEYLNQLETEHPNYTFEYVSLSKSELQPILPIPVIDKANFRPYLNVTWSDANWGADRKADADYKRCTQSGIKIEVCQSKYDLALSNPRSMSLTGTKGANLELNQLGYCGFVLPDENGKVHPFQPQFTLHYEVPLSVGYIASGSYNRWRIYKKFESKSSSGGWFSKETTHKIYEELKDTQDFSIKVRVDDPSVSAKDAGNIEQAIQAKVFELATGQFLKPTKTELDPKTLTDKRGATVVGEQLVMTGNPYAAAAGIILMGLDSIFGSSTTSSSVEQVWNQIVNVNWDSAYMIPANGTITVTVK